MKNNKIIFDFFEGNLSKSDTELFLSEMEKNPDLKKEFQEYQKVYKILNKSKNVIPNQNYFEEILIRFRSRKSNSSVFLKPVFASILIVVLTVISFAIYNYTVRNQDSILHEIVYLTDINETEFVSINEFSEMIDKEHLDDLLLTELIKGEEVNSLNNYLHLESSYNNLPENISEEIYQYLINKKIY
jgi:hypothetical protein